MVREPLLPVWWIDWFGCFAYDLNPWMPVPEEKNQDPVEKQK